MCVEEVCTSNGRSAIRRCGSDDGLRILLEANWTRIPNCPDFTENPRVSLKRLRYAKQINFKLAEL
jgi:hypothetical protein